MQQVCIRSYQPSDQKQIETIFQSGMMSYIDEPIVSTSTTADRRLLSFMEEYLSSSLADDLRNIEQVYDLQNKPQSHQRKGHFFIAFVESNPEEVLGMVALQFKSDSRAELRRMSVHPDKRGKGVGSCLIRALETFAKQQGFSTIELSTGSMMLSAIDFYTKRHQYVEVDRVSMRPKTWEDDFHDSLPKQWKNLSYVLLEKKLK